MIISYIVQMTIILAAYTTQSICLSWVKFATFPVFLLRTCQQPIVSEVYEKASKLQSRLQFPRHMAALIATMVDFQKTQAFSQITIQVTAAIAIFNGSYLSASSWTQIWNNVSLVAEMGYLGIDPTVLGMLMLRKVDKLATRRHGLHGSPDVSDSESQAGASCMQSHHLSYRIFDSRELMELSTGLRKGED